MNENENQFVPDFSPDEFDNDKEVKKWRKEKEDFLKHINNSIKIISDSFKATESSHRNLKGFELYKQLETPFIMESHTGYEGRKKIFFTIIQYYTSVRVGRVRSEGADNYFAGVITLEKKYPHTIIQPETAALKVHNLIVRGDVDFKHAKWFSFLFHVITKDEQKLKDIFENVDLGRLTRFKNAEIELKENECYFRVNKKPVSIKEAQLFTELAKTICEIF